MNNKNEFDEELLKNSDYGYNKYARRVSSTLKTIDKLIKKCKKDLKSYEGE